MFDYQVVLDPDDTVVGTLNETSRLRLHPETSLPLGPTPGKCSELTALKSGSEMQKDYSPPFHSGLAKAGQNPGAV